MSSNKESEIDSTVSGDELLEMIISFTGLPRELAQQEVDQMLSKSGVRRSGITLDEVRVAMLKYLESFSEEIDALDRAVKH